MKKIKELLLLLVKCLLLMTASIISAFLCYQLGILGLHIYDGEAPIVFFLLVGVGFLSTCSFVKPQRSTSKPFSS